MRKVAQNEKGAFVVGDTSISELRYADDTTLIETAIELMQTFLNKIKEESKKVGLYLNKDKTYAIRQAIGDNTDDTNS